MLKTFKVNNFKSFEEELFFDFTAANYAFNSQCVKSNLVKTALIFGKNASGKSNLGWAMYDIVSHLTDTNSAALPRHYYLNANSTKKAAAFRYEFTFLNKTVVYTYEKDEDRRLLSEALSIDGAEVVKFQLGSQIETTLKGTEHLNKTLSNERINISALKYIHRNANLDRRNQNNKIFNELMDFINGMLLFGGLSDGRSYVGFTTGAANIYEEILKNGHLKDFELFLKELEVNYSLVETEDAGKSTVGVQIGEKTIPLAHIASTGTANLALFYYWWQSVKDSKITLFFIDEFDSSYHYTVSAALVRRLSQLTNTQVILTTHNTSLLSNDLIRPDCAYVLEDGTIKALQHATDKELREGHSLERLYRGGAFA
jgi:AAA15 family ATPase/GTPase